MSANSPDNTLKSQYHAQVTADLESNVKEQERIATEVAALKEQLTALERDHELLTSMQQALATAEAHAGIPATEAGGRTAKAASATAAVPRPRASRKSGRTPAAAKASEKAAAAGRTKKASRNGAPTLRDLVSVQLSQQKEPRSAAEVTAALTKAHPQRNVGATVVRNTLESLVAKGEAVRSKQQNSVFYSAAGTTKQATKQAAENSVDRTPATA
ncbi:hypothetical protein AB0436_07250 [Streptomyces sp. NPDC051322]|uniref:hypothetical protein n=1 Tax=Streptomyces sp. NPDC051322 TaxID=3154645 RepID=UPI00344EC7F0